MRRSHTASWCMLLLFPVLLLAQENVDLRMVSRIKTEGFNNSKVMETVSYMTDVHGPRLTGSPQLKAASEWAAKKLSEWGLVNARLENWGTFGRGWAVEKFSIEMLEPQYSPLIAHPEAWTGSTKGTVTGDVIYAKVESLEDLEKYKGKLRGAIVLARPPVEAKFKSDPDGDRFDEKELAEITQMEMPGARQDWAARREEFRRLRALRDDGRFFAKDGIAAGVVAVPVCVEHEFQIAAVQPFECSFDFVRERRELIIDDEDSVRARRHTNIAAAAFEHIDAAGNF